MFPTALCQCAHQGLEGGVASLIIEFLSRGGLFFLFSQRERRDTSQDCVYRRRGAG